MQLMIRINVTCARITYPRSGSVDAAFGLLLCHNGRIERGP